VYSLTRLSRLASEEPFFLLDPETLADPVEELTPEKIDAIPLLRRMAAEAGVLG
jgi:hypothetical protein